jgi:ribosomal protein S14
MNRSGTVGEDTVLMGAPLAVEPCQERKTCDITGRHRHIQPTTGCRIDLREVPSFHRATEKPA